MANISVLRNSKAKAIQLSTFDAICIALECQPGDIWNIRSKPRALQHAGLRDLGSTPEHGAFL
jgi:DNA-binding Xre family transcriptional regulator